jgi:predicted ferric reductase
MDSRISMNSTRTLLARPEGELAGAAHTRALYKAGATSLAGVVTFGLAVGGLIWWLQADWYHDPGPFNSATWAGYTPPQFVGLVMFNFLTTLGYVVLYIGISTGSRLTSEHSSAVAEALWLGLECAFALASVATGIIGAIAWGGGSFMNCFGVFCVGIKKYHEITTPYTTRDSAGEGWLGIVAMAAFFALVPIGLLVLWRVARRSFVPAFGIAELNKHPHPTETVVIQQRAFRSRVLCAVAFLVSFIVILFFGWLALWMPDDWEYFTDARFAQAAQLQVVDPSLSVADRYNLCSNYYAQYTCPELPWAFFFSRQIKMSDKLYLKLFPSTVFFFCYLLGMLLAAFIVTHTNKRWAEFWAKPVPHWKRIPKRFHIRFTRGEFAGLWITKWFFMVSFIYWVHDHNFDGNWNPTNPPGQVIGNSNTERWARTMGQLATLCLSLLMFAGSRQSVLHKLLGTSWETFLWAHKALGYGMLICTFLHMVFWWRQYDMWDMFPAEIFQLPAENAEGIDNFTIPLIFLTTMVLFLCMGVFALGPIRRRFFELFYYTHLFAAWTTIPVVLWHAAAGWEYMLPGLTVWFIDRCLRASRSGARVRIVSLRTTASYDDLEHSQHKMEPARAVEIKFVVDSGALQSARPGQYVFINVPEISIFEWHPFTLSHIPCPDENRENGGNYLSLHIKSMGPNTWTDRLYEHAMGILKRDGTIPAASFTLAVDGPHGKAFDSKDHTDVILFAGGIGITPVVCIYDNFKRARRPASEETAMNDSNDATYSVHTAPRKLRCFWALREEPVLFTDVKRQLASYTGKAAGSTAREDVVAGSFTSAADATDLAFPDQRATVYLTRMCQPEVLAAHEKMKLRHDPREVAASMACGRPDAKRLLESELCDPDIEGKPLREGVKPIVFVCGPEQLIEDVMTWCDERKVAVHREVFIL